MTDVQAAPSETQPTPKKQKPTPVETITLASICKELKVDPTQARRKLRDAVAEKKLKHQAKSAWEWAKNSPDLKTVRALLRD